MSRPTLDPFEPATGVEPRAVRDRATWLRACFAPTESFFDAGALEDGDEPGWHPIAFWWPTSVGVQLVLMPCRSLVQ